MSLLIRMKLGTLRSDCQRPVISRENSASSEMIEYGRLVHDSLLFLIVVLRFARHRRQRSVLRRAFWLQSCELLELRILGAGTSASFELRRRPHGCAALLGSGGCFFAGFGAASGQPSITPREGPPACAAVGRKSIPRETSPSRIGRSCAAGRPALPQRIGPGGNPGR